MENLQGKLNEYKFETTSKKNENSKIGGSELSSTMRATHRPTNRKVNLTKLSVKKNSKRYKGLVECIKKGVVYVYDMFSAESKSNVHVYIILPLTHKNDPNLCSLEKANDHDLHLTRKSLFFKNLTVALRTVHDMNLSHLAIDLANVWIEDMFYVYLGPFSLDEKKDELDCNLAFAAPEILLCQDYSYDSKMCDLWSLGVVYCSLMLPGFHEFVTNRIKSLEDYLIFYDMLVGYPDAGGLSYMPSSTFHKLRRLIKKFKMSGLSKSRLEEGEVEEVDSGFDEELISRWAQEVRGCQLMSRLLHWEPKSRYSCAKILEYDFFREKPAIPTDRQSKENDYGPFNRDKSILKNSKKYLKKALDGESEGALKYKSVKGGKNREFRRHRRGRKDQEGSYQRQKNKEKMPLPRPLGSNPVTEDQENEPYVQDLRTVKMAPLSRTEEEIRRTVKTGPIKNYEPGKLVISGTKDLFSKVSGKSFTRNPSSSKDMEPSRDISYKSKSRSRNNSYENYLYQANLKKIDKTQNVKRKKINLGIDPASNHGVNGKVRSQKRFVSHRQDGLKRGKFDQKNEQFYSAEPKLVTTNPSPYPSLSKPSTKYPRKMSVYKEEDEFKIEKKGNLRQFDEDEEQQITFDKGGSEVEGSLGNRDSKIQVIDGDGRKYSEEYYPDESSKYTSNGYHRQRERSISLNGAKNTPKGEDEIDEIMETGVLNTGDELCLRGEIMHTDDEEGTYDGNLPLSEKLKGLFSAKETHRDDDNGFKQIRILVCTSELIFNRDLTEELKGGILEAQYKLIYSFIGKDVVQESLSTVIRGNIVKCETNFEIIVDYKHWEELLEMELTLNFTISKDNIGDSVHLGSSKIDLKSLYFIFFNGREVHTKMEKKLVNIYENQREIIGVLEVASAVSNILDDNDKHQLSSKKPPSKSSVSLHLQSRSRGFEKPSISIPEMTTPLNTENLNASAKETTLNTSYKRRRASNRPKELETPKEFTELEKQKRGRQRHKKIPNHLKGFKNRKYSRGRMNRGNSGKIKIEENEPQGDEEEHVERIERNKSLPNYTDEESDVVETQHKERYTSNLDNLRTGVESKGSDAEWESVDKEVDNGGSVEIEKNDKIPPRRNPIQMLKKLQKEYERYNKDTGDSSFKAFASKTGNSSLNNSYNQAIKELRDIIYED